MRYTSRMNFEKFLEIILAGLFYAGCVLFFVVLFGGMAIGTIHDQEINERNLFLALQGKNVTDKDILSVAAVVQQMYEGKFQNWSYIGYLRSPSKTRYLVDFAFEHWSETVGYIENHDKEIPEKDTWAWWWFKIFPWIFVIGANIGVSLNYFYEARKENNRGDKWWQYPWKEPLAYPLVFAMLPYVVLTQPAVAVYAIFRKVSGIDRREEEAERRETERRGRQGAPNERPSPDAGYINSKKYHVKPKILNQKKAEFQAKVEAVNQNREINRRNWIDIHNQPLREKRDSITRLINSVRSKISEFGRSIENSQRELAKYQENLKEIERLIELKKNPEDVKKFEEEFNQLLQFYQVKAVEVAPDEILVYTDTIYLAYAGRKYEIGNFLIRIGTSGEGYIKVENLCNTSSVGRHHPYGGSGRDSDSFCFGTIYGEIRGLLTKRDYLTLIMVVLQSLRTADGDTPERIPCWREVE